MRTGRRIVRRPTTLEWMEDRLLPSGGGVHSPSRTPLPRAHLSQPDVFVANLVPGQVVLPLDQGNPANSPGQTGASQIQGSGGAAIFPTPAPNDPAKGKITFTITDGGKDIKVTGILSDISNVSAVTIHDLNMKDLAVFPLRGTTTSPATQPPALLPNNSGKGTAIYYSSNTVNSAQPQSGQAGQTGQVISSNFGQTVDLLLNPGPGGGPVGPHATFRTDIRAQYLQGPLSMKGGFARFIQDMRIKELYVLVQTNDGYDSTTGAQEDGNYPNGELRGQITPLD